MYDLYTLPPRPPSSGTMRTMTTTGYSSPVRALPIVNFLQMYSRTTRVRLMPLCQCPSVCASPVPSSLAWRPWFPGVQVHWLLGFLVSLVSWFAVLLVSWSFWFLVFRALLVHWLIQSKHLLWTPRRKKSCARAPFFE